METKSRRNIFKLIDAAVQEQPIEKAFLADVCSAIEKQDMKSRSKKPSPAYKPSSFVCMRQMYFMLTSAEPDGARSDYTAVGMADTGSRRHEAIQDVLINMESMGYDWRYVDVADYLAEMQLQGKCLDLEVKGKRGAETRLYNKTLNISFMCDGVMLRLSTGRYYLFEFKNQVSFKANNKTGIDDEHKPQAALYCLNLELETVLFLYENRDVCELQCHPYIVTQADKQECLNKIFECDGYVERLIPPPKHETNKPCRWCSYKLECKKAGN